MNYSNDCQMVKEFGNLKFRIEEMQNIPICDLIYKIDIAKLLPYIEDGPISICWLLSITIPSGVNKQNLLRNTI